jgi:hypothetical protein
VLQCILISPGGAGAFGAAMHPAPLSATYHRRPARLPGPGRRPAPQAGQHRPGVPAVCPVALSSHSVTLAGRGDSVDIAVANIVSVIVAPSPRANADVWREHRALVDLRRRRQAARTRRGHRRRLDITDYCLGPRPP